MEGCGVMHVVMTFCRFVGVEGAGQLRLQPAPKKEEVPPFEL